MSYSHDDSFEVFDDEDVGMAAVVAVAGLFAFVILVGVVIFSFVKGVIYG